MKVIQLVKVPTRPHSLVFIVADGDNGDPRCEGPADHANLMVIE